jgi:FkbM family methyltransferase
MRPNYRGKWRVDKVLLPLIKLTPGFYLHPFGFWWRIDDKSTKKTFLSNCEASTSSLFRKFCGTERMVFVDIGSNLGWYSLLAKSLNPQTEVLAFEPVNPIRQKLNENIKRNGFQDTHVYPCALGVKPKLSLMWSYSSNDGMSTLHPIEEWGPTAAHEVEVETLDQYADLILKPNLPILMKLDVEGSEMEVLKGGISVLKQQDVNMIIEVNEKMLLAGKSSAKELFAFLSSFGFYGYWISSDETLIIQHDGLPLPHKGNLPVFEGANYFFTKDPKKISAGVNLK